LENEAAMSLRQIPEKAPRPSGGFTLMELLVSMSLMGLVAVAVLFGFRIGTNAWAKGGASLNRLGMAQAAFDLMNRQIGSMKAYYSRQTLKEAPVELLLFQGTETGMRFVSNFSLQSRSAGGLWLVEYFVATSKDSRQRNLILNETPLPGDEVLSQSVFSDLEMGEDNRPVVRFPAFRARPDSMRLIENAQEIQFQYFVPPGPAPAQSISTGKEQLPQGVKIVLRWQEPDLLSAKDLSVVVPIHASVRQQ
jgi:prepilin-type N-terminal cleavage/methylation domain-containing protein